MGAPCGRGRIWEHVEVSPSTNDAGFQLRRLPPDLAARDGKCLQVTAAAGTQGGSFVEAYETKARLQVRDPWVLSLPSEVADARTSSGRRGELAVLVFWRRWMAMRSSPSSSSSSRLMITGRVLQILHPGLYGPHGILPS